MELEQHLIALHLPAFMPLRIDLKVLQAIAVHCLMLQG